MNGNDILERLRTDDVALNLTHGEGEAFYAWINGQLHHYREHPSAESCEPGEESLERFAIDLKNLSVFQPKFVPIDSTPFDNRTENEVQ